jgi:NADH:ubiquinone reductase (non-electrogenic)
MELGPQNQPIRRALSVDDKLRVIGSDNIWAIGDSSVMKANYPATAQVASQQGRFLGRLFNKVSGPMYKDKKENTHTVDTFLKNAEPFIYQHFGSFAYIGDREAVADFRNTAGGTTSTGLGVRFLDFTLSTVHRAD